MFLDIRYPTKVENGTILEIEDSPITLGKSASLLGKYPRSLSMVGTKNVWEMGKNKTIEIILKRIFFSKP